MTRTKLFALAALLLFALGASVVALAQDERVSPPAQVHQQSAPQPEIYRPAGTVVTPRSDSAPAGYAHTNYKVFVPQGRRISSPQPDYTFAETPASLGCVYAVGPSYPGCNPALGGTNHPTGGWGAIVLVDAYDNPNAGSDLAFFSSSFSLPKPNFKKIYANQGWGNLSGLQASCLGKPAGDPDWGLEEDLDIQWAHAMAPDAQIVLVEACSNSTQDLLFAEVVANIVAQQFGGGDISNSWGGSESKGQLGMPAQLPLGGWDNVFYRQGIGNASWATSPFNIVYFASAGDSGHYPPSEYPSTNPWVVSAGGTTVNRDQHGNFVSESCWSGSGGGPSHIEFYQVASIFNGPGPWTNYQYGLFGGFPYHVPPRDTPDIAFDADPNSGVYVYDTYTDSPGWYIVGGTSVSSPALAGIVNSANNRLGQATLQGGLYTNEENNLLYSQEDAFTAYPANFYDVTTGSNGVPAGPGYDECTGVGTPRGKLGK